MAIDVVDVPVAIEPSLEVVGRQVDIVCAGEGQAEVFGVVGYAVVENINALVGRHGLEVVGNPGIDVFLVVRGGVVAAIHGGDYIVYVADVEGIPRWAIDRLKHGLAVGTADEVVVADAVEDLRLGHAGRVHYLDMAFEAGLVADVAGVDNEGHMPVGSVVAQGGGPLVIAGGAAYLGIGDVDKRMAAVTTDACVVWNQSEIITSVG